MNDLELMRLRLDVLYTYDERGRLLLSNEPIESARVQSPDLALGIANGQSLFRAGANVPDDVIDRLGAIPAGQLLATGTEKYFEALERELRPLGEWTRSGGPAYRFPQTPEFSAEAIEITEATRSVLQGHTEWFFDEYNLWGRAFAIVRNGIAVSTCFSSRQDDRSAEAGLWTDPDFRGQGFAWSVTQSWAAAVYESGRIPFYSTSWDNVASQNVARKLGLISIGEDITYRLTDLS
jgi:RimJ/RimL family protein N-acetyltransferase